MVEQKKRERSQTPSVITVRMPVALHEALKIEAHEHRVSLNRLCVDKLLRPLGLGQALHTTTPEGGSDAA